MRVKETGSAFFLCNMDATVTGEKVIVVKKRRDRNQ